MAKSELREEKSAKKRKLSEIEDQTNGDDQTAQKKAKKDKKDKKAKKTKKDKDGKRKSRKEMKAEQAEELNAAEYDTEDKAIEEPMTVEAEMDEAPGKEKKMSSKKEAKKEAKNEAKKERKKEKKDKFKGAETTNEVAAAPVQGKSEAEAEVKDKKSKKDKKDKAEKNEKKKKDKKDKNDKKEKKGSNGINVDGEDQQMADAEEGAGAEDRPAKETRFICFIGNLPFTATKADVEAHFAALQPTSVRLLTERDQPTKSRGIAFVEFSNYAHMKTCLAKFHHTELSDSQGKNTRRINVELTAGGGGKTDARMGKVKERNIKLNEERGRRIAREEAEKAEAARKKSEGTGAAPAAAAKKVVDNREEVFVHPSRRAHVPGRRT